MTCIKDQTPVARWGLRPRLQFLMLMLLKAGTKAFRAFNQNYRILANSNGFQPSDHQLADMLATAIATAAGYDVTPFIALGGLPCKTPPGNISLRWRQNRFIRYIFFCHKMNGIAHVVSWGWTLSSGWWITANWRL